MQRDRRNRYALNTNENLKNVSCQHGTEQTDENIQHKYGFSHQSIHERAAGIEETAPEVINAIAAPGIIPISIRPEIRGMAA